MPPATLCAIHALRPRKSARRQKPLRLLGLLLCLIVTACGSSAEITPTTRLSTRTASATPTATPTATASATPTATPTAGATPAAAPIPTATPTATPTASATPTPSPTKTASPVPSPLRSAIPSPPHPLPPSPQPPFTPTNKPHLVVQEQPGGGGHPTLADLWDGRAAFVFQVADTGLPMGESDTIVMSNGELWSYLHASIGAAGTVDRCGDPVEFPGCTVIYRSYDGGYTFQHDDPPVCQFRCATCPCQPERDHVNQQQYPRLHYDGQTLLLVYEYLGRAMLRRSTDGLNWSAPQRVALSGVWKLWLRGCPASERIGPHPFVPYDFECLAGGPPGIYVEGGRAYVFMAVGQNPGGMGCYYGAVDAPAGQFRRCAHNPLFGGANEYGPHEQRGAAANPYFDFRTISSAEVQKIGGRYYALYEGVRGPGPGDPGDSQFGLGLARSLGAQIDGPWEKYPGNPLLVDLPGNIGLGHADLLVYQGQTLLYTSLDGHGRSRLALVWRTGPGF